MSAEDKAQEIELLEYVRTQQRAIQPKGKSFSHCMECGDEIPIARQLATIAKRCMFCQEEHDLINRSLNRLG